MTEDRERTVFAATVAALGAMLCVAGALLAKLADLLIPWGFVLLVLGGLAVVHAIAVGLGLLPVPGSKENKNRP